MKPASRAIADDRIARHHQTQAVESERQIVVEGSDVIHAAHRRDQESAAHSRADRVGISK
ncbi:hypothetical protein D4739_00470 [Nocardioides cavernaquae]|uniref:Uncharacterized protein n=1 Tax=Nocardioides cavernaquae TaxID=2321396 RepID=A0A3A5H618_9ACTN|nr:hypothetical protein D4739_00470 [Nocardioides cavernaquae]